MTHTETERLLAAWLVLRPERAQFVLTEWVQDADARKIVAAVQAMHAAGTEVDPYSVICEAGLRSNALLTYTDIMHDASMGVELLVRENFLARETAKILASVQDEHTGLDRIELALSRLEAAKACAMHGLRQNADDDHEEFVESLHPTAAIYKTHLSAIDSNIGGLEDGDYALIAARPGIGKTSLACTLAYNIAAGGTGVEYHSYEMRRKKVRRFIVSRMSLAPGGMPVGIGDMRKRAMNDAQIAYCAELSQRIKETLPITIHDSAGEEVSLLCAKIRTSKVPIHFVDHILCVPVNGTKTEYERVSRATNRLRETAKATGKIIIPLVQLNRESVRANRAPNQTDLRESGKLEEDADIIMMLHEPEREQNKIAGARLVGIDVIFEKVREGMICQKRVFCNRPYAFFYDPDTPDVNLPF